MAIFKKESVRVYAVSYDSEKELKAFADGYGITYDLLSDVGSAVISKFGILNTTISPDDTQKSRQTGRSFYGVPFPGVYVVDQTGTVSEKFFHRHYATRASAGSIRDSVIGRILSAHEVPAAELRTKYVEVSAFLADEALRFEVTTMLNVRIEVAEGYHIYADPLPRGFIATRVSVPETRGLRIGEAVYPVTQSREFPKLGVTLQVYEKVVDVTIPVTANAEILNWPIRDKPTSLEIPISVLYQACSEKICHLPKSEQVLLKVPIKPLVMPGPRRSGRSS